MRKTQEEELASLSPEKQAYFEKIRGIPFDPRFPNTNQTRNCNINFLDYQRCVKARGKDFEACRYFEKAYRSLCPHQWVEKWNEQIEEGRFPHKI